MAVPSKYQAKEVLNKVLNAGEDALKVDLADSVTIAVDLDHDDDSVQIYGTDGTLRAITTDASGNLQVDVLTAPTTAVTGTFWQSTQPVSGTVTVSSLLPDGHAVTIDNAIDNEVYVRGSGTAGTADVKVLTVQGIASGVAQPVSGTFWQSTQPVSLASVPSHAVTVTSNVPGVAATSLGKAEDAVHGSGDTGVVSLVVRNDVLEGLTSDDGDYSVLQVNKTGALNVTETVGHLGAHYENGTTARSSMKIVAFQFLEDTKFGLLTPATSAYIGNTGSGGEDVPNDEVFPQGMTIFGRWTAFTLISGGRVIAYLGDW